MLSASQIRPLADTVHCKYSFTYLLTYVTSPVKCTDLGRTEDGCWRREQVAEKTARYEKICTKINELKTKG